MSSRHSIYLEESVDVRVFILKYKRLKKQILDLHHLLLGRRMD